MLAGVESRANPRRYPGTELSARVDTFAVTQAEPRPVDARRTCQRPPPAEKLQQKFNAFIREVTTTLVIQGV